jgi:hypothetical protein
MDYKELTREQAAIIGAYTGIACSSFTIIHEYAEQKLNRPVFTHEFANAAFMATLKNASKEDFLKLCYKGE